MSNVWKSFFLVALVALTACGRTYDQVPDAFFGKWSSDKLSSIVAAEISAREITLIDEDGRSETCSVDYVSVDYPLFGNSKTTTAVCNTGLGSANKKAERVCSSRDSKLYRWTIILKQDDSENYGLVDVLENTDTSCEDVDHDMPLGVFHKQSINVEPGNPRVPTPLSERTI